MVRPPIILDTDPGLDDVFAFAVAQRYAEIVGITAVAGNVTVEHTGANAVAVADFLGIDAPVHVGAAGPLAGRQLLAREVHGGTGLGRVHRPATTRRTASSDAVEFLIETTRRRSGVHIVAIGPLTNIALALRADPALATRVASITFMGGSATFGNVTPAAEFNVYADPEAAAEVIGSGAPLTMVGLHLTHQVMMTADHRDQLRGVGTERGTFFADVADSRMDFYTGVLGMHDAPMHDPCAVLAVTHPELFAGVLRHVAVETRGDHTRGMTVVDRRVGGTATANVDVLDDVDAAAALELILAAAA